MTFKEACESGKPFRHKSWEFYWDKDEFIEDFQGMVSYEEAISEDWEIQQKETFTRADVERAVMTAASRIKLHFTSSNIPHDTWVKAIEEAMKAADSGDEK